ADQVRVGDQSEDREDAWPGRARHAARSCRRGDRLKRREFITLLGGAAVVWPLVARAQQPAKLPTIGFLGASTPLFETQRVASFVQQLHELGWNEGRDVKIEYRWAEDAASASPRLRKSSSGSRSMSLSPMEHH